MKYLDKTPTAKKDDWLQADDVGIVPGYQVRIHDLG